MVPVMRTAVRRTLAAAVTAGLLVVAGCDGSSEEPDARPDDTTTSASTSATTSPSGDPGPVVECPDDVAEPDPGLPDAVPDGATSVRLCDGGADRVTPPLDALTTGVASVADAVNGQPLAVRNCADRQLPTYQLAFGYPDGSSFTVAGRFTGCGELLVGSARRAKAGPALHEFVGLLVEQRSILPPPGRTVDPADIDCAQPREDWTWPLADPTGLTVGVLCVGDVQRPERARRATVPPDDLDTLVASIGTHTVSTAGQFCPFVAKGSWIVGANAWGDPVTMPRGCLGLTIEGDLEWLPRGQARGIVKRLAGQAR